MNTINVKVGTKNVMEGKETSFQLFKIVEDGDIFEPIENVNQQSGNFMQIERVSDDEDGTFPKVSSYIKLVRDIDKNGVSAFLDWYSSKKLKFDCGYCTIERESFYSDKAKLIFSEPIEIIVSKQFSELISTKVNVIYGEFTYEWSWMKNGRQGEVANVCEIYFDCQKFELIEPSKKAIA